jgi:hypothetical protein
LWAQGGGEGGVCAHLATCDCQVCLTTRKAGVNPAQCCFRMGMCAKVKGEMQKGSVDRRWGGLWLPTAQYVSKGAVRSSCRSVPDAVGNRQVDWAGNKCE